MRRETTKRVVKVRSAKAMRHSAALTAAAFGCAGSAALAQTPVTWNAGTGSYVTGTNWTPNVVPANANNEFLTINNGGTAQVTTGDAAEGAFLNLGLQSGQSGNLTIDGGTLTVGEMRVGGRDVGTANTFNAGGTGTVVQTGGTVNVTFTPGSEPPIQSLYVGDAGGGTSGGVATAVGSYTISGGSLTAGIATDDAIVIGTGSGTVGSFVHTGTGLVKSTGFLIVGRGGAVGNYTLETGNTGTNTALQVAGTVGLVVGESSNGAGGDVAGTGTFTHRAGSILIGSTDLVVGRRQGVGTYNMSGGTIDIPNGSLVVGSNGSASVTALQTARGEMTMTSGQINVGNTSNTNGGNINISLGNSTVAGTITGKLTMNGGQIDLLKAGSIFAVGNGLGEVGTVEQTGGTINQTGSTALMSIGRNSGVGTYKLTGGTLNVRDLNIGASGVAGSSLTISSTAVFSATGSLVVGNSSPGLLTINGGTVTINTLTVNSGNQAHTRTVNITGGNVEIFTLNNGSVASQATRLVDITGGNVTIHNLSSGGATTGAGTSTIYLRGGTVLIENLTLFTGSNFRLGMNYQTAAPATYGNATVEVDPGFTMTFNGTWGTGSTNRTLTKIGSGTMTIGTSTQTYAAGAALIVSAGTVNVNSSATSNLTVTANSTLNFNASQPLGGLTVGNGATTTLASHGQRSIITPTLAITGGGRLDLKDNHLIVKTTPIGTLVGTTNTYDGITGMIQSGRNGGDWSGSGIVTSLTDATTSNFTSIGVATGQQALNLSTATDTGTWAGQTVTGSDTLVMYTYGGDANLDGKITISDYGKIDFNVGIVGASGWANGDFNYDGKITISDYGIIDFNVGIQGPPFFAGSGAGGGLSGVAAVPEPLGLSAFALAALAARRRRRSS